MILVQTAPTTIADLELPAPSTMTCADCPFARHIDGNRYCCSVSQTASDVKRGHWLATISCVEALAKAEAEKVEPVAEVEIEVEAPIAKTDANEQTSITPAAPSPAAPSPAKPATASHTAPASIPAATGTDNGRGQVQPVPAKKLMLSLVSVKRISSDIPASNFDPNELEIAGELSLAIGGFVIPPVVVRDSSGYRVIAGHFQYHAAVLARQLNPRAGETIPVIVLESENQSAAMNQLKRLKFAA